MKEGKWEQIRDISKKSSPPARNAEPETPMSPKRPIEAEEGRGKRIKYPNPYEMSHIMSDNPFT